MKTLALKIPSSLLVAIASLMTVLQMIFAFIFRGPPSVMFEWLGWICLWSAGIFGMIPIFTFRHKGDVPKGKSYIHTSRLVTSGIYGIVRHPQNGTAWMLINLGLMLIVRNWTSYVPGVLSMFLAYLDSYHEDQRCIVKFGPAYTQYISRVPRINFLYGIYLLIKNR